MNASLVLEDGSRWMGRAFGYKTSVAGEVVFNTGMVGYPECLTDPSYRGQILTLTYPLIGNYGVPANEDRTALHRHFESNRIQVTGLIVSEHSLRYSHYDHVQDLDRWLEAERIPAIAEIDTRGLTQQLRAAGVMLGKIVQEKDAIEFTDPNSQNLVAQVSTQQPIHYTHGHKKVLVIDCGCKNNIVRSLLGRGLSVTVVPWNLAGDDGGYCGMVISNGPGDPTQCTATIRTIQQWLPVGKPIFGICLGNQLLALAAGARTYKLKYGHRGQNQPCVLVGTNRCFITSQNHGYAVDESTLPADWVPWFFNANDGSNEGIRHRTRPYWSVQFHPEAFPGPTDTQFLFDEFVKML